MSSLWRRGQDHEGSSDDRHAVLLHFLRQLEHVLLNAWVLCDQPEVDADDIELPDAPIVVLPSLAPGAPESGRASASRAAESARKAETLSSHRRSERERIIEALEACNWNRVKAAELSGIPRRTFYRRLREYKIQ